MAFRPQKVVWKIISFPRRITLTSTAAYGAADSDFLDGVSTADLDLCFGLNHLGYPSLLGRLAKIKVKVAVKGEDKIE